MKSSDNTFSVEKAEESSGFLLWQVTSLWHREIKKALEKYGITHSQYVLLASIHWLTLSGQEVTQVLLSNHTKIDPMTTSTVLRTLQQKSLIQRQENKRDTRAKTVELTEEGKILIKQAIPTVEKFDLDFFSLLGGRIKELNENFLILLGLR